MLGEGFHAQRLHGASTQSQRPEHQMAGYFAVTKTHLCRLVERTGTRSPRLISHSCMVSLNIVKHFLWGTTLSPGGIVFECIYLYTLTYTGLKTVKQKNNIYFRKRFNYFFKSFFLSFFLAPEFEVLISHDKRSAICTKKRPTVPEKYLKMCFWATCFIDLLATFQTASRAVPGYKELHIKYCGCLSPPHGFSIPLTCFSLYCVERPNVSSRFTLLLHQPFPIKQCLQLIGH